MEFKDRLKALRTQKKLSAADLAKNLVPAKSESAIRMWEAGKNKPDADTLIKLAEYFDCTTDYLLGLSEYKNAVDFNNREKKLEGLEEALKLIPHTQEREFLAYALSPALEHIYTISPSKHTAGNTFALLCSMIHFYSDFLCLAKEFTNKGEEALYLRFINFPHNFSHLNLAIIRLLEAALDNAETPEIKNKLIALISRDYEIHHKDGKSTIKRRTIELSGNAGISLSMSVTEDGFQVIKAKDRKAKDGE